MGLPVRKPKSGYGQKQLIFPRVPHSKVVGVLGESIHGGHRGLKENLGSDKQCFRNRFAATPLHRSSNSCLQPTTPHMAGFA